MVVSIAWRFSFPPGWTPDYRSDFAFSAHGPNVGEKKDYSMRARSAARATKSGGSPHLTDAWGAFKPGTPRQFFQQKDGALITP